MTKLPKKKKSLQIARDRKKFLQYLNEGEDRDFLLHTFKEKYNLSTLYRWLGKYEENRSKQKSITLVPCPN